MAFLTESSLKATKTVGDLFVEGKFYDIQNRSGDLYAITESGLWKRVCLDFYLNKFRHWEEGFENLFDFSTMDLKR